MTDQDTRIGRTLCHYRVTSRLGAGGMGVVYEAEDLQLGRRVALKFLPPELARDETALQRLQREARAACALNHPNICTVHAIDRHDTDHFIVMELLEGQTLASRIAHDGPVPIAELLEIALQIVDALESAHARGVVHRDLKPANAFLTARGQVKVLDFGLARFDMSAAETSGGGVTVPELTRSGTTFGTVSYMSPEQARGEVADARSDIFSLGVVLYEMATGRLPFKGETVAVMFDRLLNHSPAPPRELVPSLLPEFDRIVAQALEKDRRYRFQSASELRSALLRLRRDLDTRPRDSGSTPPSARAASSMMASVAVLYFDNLSGAKEDEYLRDGITEDIITELSKIRELKPRSRASVLAFRDTPVTPVEVGQKLGASCVLTGSVRRLGNRLRINTQLIDTRTDYPLWSERYDRELEDIFDVQAEIAHSIAEAMRITLSPQEQQELGLRPTQNPQAYDVFLRGRSYARRQSRIDLDIAMQMFEHAVALDSSFGLAHAAIASTAAQYFYFCDRSPRWMDRAKEATAVASRLAHGAPEVLVAQAWLAQAEKRFDEAEADVRSAIRTNPGVESGYYLLARILFAAGKYHQLMDISEQLLANAVEDYNIWVPIRNACRALGREDHARILLQRELQVFTRQVDRVPEDARARVLLASDYAHLGRDEEARRELQLALTLRPNDGVLLYNAACVLCTLGLKAEAMQALNDALNAGFRPHIGWARQDRDLALLHGDPQFEEMFPHDVGDDRKD